MWEAADTVSVGMLIYHISVQLLDLETTGCGVLPC